MLIGKALRTNGTETKRIYYEFGHTHPMLIIDSNYYEVKDKSLKFEPFGMLFHTLIAIRKQRARYVNKQ